ncbi:MAG: TRAP transporter small permease [Casimicrobiaceae bacterium]
MLTWLGKFEEWLIAAILALMTTITFVQVVARYVFNYSFVWALELVTYLFAWLIFLGMAYGVRVGAHIGVDSLVKNLKPGPARSVGAIAALLCIVYSVIGLIGGSVYVKKMYDVGILAQDLPIEQWIPRLVLPLGFALLAVRFSELFYRIVTGRESGLHLADEAADALRLKAEEPPAGGGEQR